MTEQYRTTGTNRNTNRRSGNGPTNVIAKVTYYSPIKGFGFAQSDDYLDPRTGDPARIFFRKETCRVVSGLPRTPKLTSTKRDCPFDSAWPVESLVMDVVPTDKGPKAIAWGVVPARTAYTDLVEAGGLERYIGGRVSLMHLRGRNDHITGIVRSIKLEPEGIELDLSEVYENAPGGNLRKVPYGLLPSFPLWDAMVQIGERQCFIRSWKGMSHETTLTLDLPDGPR